MSKPLNLIDQHKIRIGACAWSFDDWRGAFYPPQLPHSRWLEFYARHFSAVEVDSTFYHTPGAHAVAHWLDQTPDAFCFVCKAPREVTWMSGVVMLLIVLGLGFTGYLLPWDQLAIWAITVGSNMAKATPLVGAGGPFVKMMMFPGTDVPMIHAGSDARFFLLAGTFVGENALLRFYVLHCVFIPVIVTVLIAIHFWRIRKDGGISGPL